MLISDFKCHVCMSFFSCPENTIMLAVMLFIYNIQDMNTLAGISGISVVVWGIWDYYIFQKGSCGKENTRRERVLYTSKTKQFYYLTSFHRSCPLHKVNAVNSCERAFMPTYIQFQYIGIATHHFSSIKNM